jgi:hypothetical protein
MMTARLLRALVVAAALAAALAPGARAYDDDEVRKFWSFGALGGVWGGLLSGSARLPVTFTSGPFGATLGKVAVDVDDLEPVPFAQIFATSPYVSVYAGAWYGRFQDETKVTANFTFAGVNFSGAVPVRGEMKVLTADARIQVNPLALEFLELGVSAGVRYFDVDATVSGTDPTTGTRVQAGRSIEAPIPQAGLSLTVFIGSWLDIYVRARGIAFTYQDESVRQAEGEAGVAFNIGSHVSIGVEYRAFWVEYDDRKQDLGADRIAVEALLQGPAAYLRVRF